MLRFLPYIIICLLVILSGKMLNIFDKGDDSSLYNTEVSVAQAATEQAIEVAEQKNVDIVTTSNSETTKKDEKVYDDNIKDLPNISCIPYVKQASSTELEILKNLKQRREELEGREKELLFKESAIQLTKNQIDERLTALQLLRDELKIIMKQYDIKESEKNTKLVKIYENMRPKEAAKIFEEMQLNVLLDVVEKMRETRLAPILASMEPFKAKEITVALATRRKSININ